MATNPVVIFVSADKEWQVVIDYYRPKSTNFSPYGDWFDQWIDIQGKPIEVRFFHGGWGKVSAAGSTQFAISEWHPELLINLGTCGGFLGYVNVGDIILVNETIIYDIVEQMFDSETAIEAYKTKLDISWLSLPFPQPVIEIRIVSADRDLVGSEIELLNNKYGAMAGDWESGAIAYVASHNQLRCLILRGVSDLVDANGGEAYQDQFVFADRAKMIMFDLLDHLPAWLVACGCNK